MSSVFIEKLKSIREQANNENKIKMDNLKEQVINTINRSLEENAKDVRSKDIHAVHYIQDENDNPLMEETVSEILKHFTDMGFSDVHSDEVKNFIAIYVTV